MKQHPLCNHVKPCIILAPEMLMQGRLYILERHSVLPTHIMLEHQLLCNFCRPRVMLNADRGLPYKCRVPCKHNMLEHPRLCTFMQRGIIQKQGTVKYRLPNMLSTVEHKTCEHTTAH
eukprot:Tamp_12968.p2 GENE.Tamp_12968~~Tamp_12968.p2  ORF type:complete len:118 (+),score=13.56 Tamp_12968:1393-1746(+)